MLKAKNKGNLTEGPLFTRMFLFVIPIVLTGVLQVAYNIADNIVVGRFSGDPTALAAVGSTSSLTALITGFLLGIASGSGVVIAHFFGAKEYSEVSKTVHTAMLFSLIGGIFFMLLGLVISEPALVLMKTKPEILDKSVLYIRIICIGIPAASVYNFGAATLRSVGNSKMPLLILSVSGIINVALNFVFVIVFNMSVAGVAIATISSQYASAAWVVLFLMKRKESCYQLSLKKLKLEKRLLIRILRLGLPAGIQSSLFSISNVLIMSAFNTFPTTTVSGRTIAINIENLLYTSLNAYMQAAMTFIGQNYGAKKNRRLNKVFIYSVVQVLIFAVLVCFTISMFKTPLSILFMDPEDPNKELVLEVVERIFNLLLPTYFLCGLMDTLAGILRGFGYSIMSMISSLIGLGIRVLWTLFVFPLEKFNTIEGITISYPISWAITAMLSLLFCGYVWHKLGIWKGARLEKENESKNINKEITA